MAVRPLGLQFVDRAGPATLMALGGLIGIVMCGIWTLGFLYPFTAHNAGLRTLELEAHKLEGRRMSRPLAARETMNHRR